MNPTNRRNTLPSGRASLASASLALLLSLSAGTADAGDWSWTFTPYAWATDVGVDVKLGGRQIVDETIPISDLLDDLDMILQGRFEAQKGTFGASLDMFYVAMSDAAAGAPLPQNAGQADVDWTMDMTIADAAGFYDPNGDRRGLSILAGTRIIDQRGTADATFHLPSGGSAAQSYQGGETLVDGLIGVRFSQPFAKRWSYHMQLDASAGGTDFTWSAEPSLGYAFGSSGRFALTAGYRRMQINFQDDGELGSEMVLSGALVGFRMSF